MAIERGYVQRSMTAAMAFCLLAPAAAAENGPGLALQAGAFIAVAPKYEGSDQYEAIGVPFIAPSGDGLGNGLVQFRGPDDLRFRLLEWKGFEAGPLVGWRFDREESDGNTLRGLGDVDGGFVAGGYAAYRVGPFMPFVSYHHQVSGDETGGIVRFGAEAKHQLAAWLAVTATAGATYAGEDYMDAYFSITPEQSAASRAGLAVYEADAGIKDVFFGLSGDVPLSDRWTLKVSGRYTRLVGDAAGSPIVESEDQFFGGLGLTYRFGLGN